MTETNNTNGNQKSLDLNNNDELYLEWARDIGFSKKIKVAKNSKDGASTSPSIRSQVDYWLDVTYNPVIDKLWKKHVPRTGACKVLQGEMARCINRLFGEYFRNGMMNMGEGYYDDMVDKIEKTVLEDIEFSPLVQQVMKADCAIVKGANYDEIVGNNLIFTQTDVEVSLRRMKMVVATWCQAHKEPIDYSPMPWE